VVVKVFTPCLNSQTEHFADNELNDCRFTSNLTMSSNLLNSIPSLEGTTNYKQWQPLMRSFLMVQGLWIWMNKVRPLLARSKLVTTIVPAVPPNEDGSGGSKETTITTSQTLTDEEFTKLEEKVDEWEENNAKALGSITLRLHSSIAYQVREVDDASELWKDLESRYGKPSPAAAYIEFKKVLNTRIPNNADPSLAIDEMCAHLGRLAQMEFEIPPKIGVLLLMAKLPPSMENIAQELNRDDDFGDTTFEEVRRMILLSWEQRSGHPRQQQKAQKLSTIKRAPNDPSFASQQNNGEGSSRGEEGPHTGGKGALTQGIH